MDWADKWVRDIFKEHRKGSQISAGCSEIYPAVAEALRDAFIQGCVREYTTRPKKPTQPANK